MKLIGESGKPMRQRSIALLLLLLILSLTLLTACGSRGTAQEESAALGGGETANTEASPAFPSFATTDLAGNPVDSGSFAGYKITMVNI